MRLKHLTKGEFSFLYRYGILYLYGVLTVLYLCFLAALPPSARKTAAALLVFTDPAAMGLFFMGAVVLLEKSQRVESSLAVSPVKHWEYITAKCLPFLSIGLIAGLLLCLFAGTGSLLSVLTGVACSSVLFSLCGLIAGACSKSLNGFVIACIPFEIFICLPAVLYLFGVLHASFWILHPGVAAIMLIDGETDRWFLGVLVLVLWTIPAFLFCKKAVNRSFSQIGGAKL